MSRRGSCGEAEGGEMAGGKGFTGEVGGKLRSRCSFVFLVCVRKLKSWWLRSRMKRRIGWVE